LRKATLRFVMSCHVCPSVHLSVRMEQLGSYWRDVHEIWCLRIFKKMCRENLILIKIWQSNGYFISRCMFVIYRWIILRMRNVSGKSCRRNQNTRFMLNDENHGVYEIMWENYGRARQAADDSIIRRRKYAICMPAEARIQTHTRNISYLLLFHGKNGNANAP
jgi:hypothetical protein